MGKSGGKRHSAKISTKGQIKSFILEAVHLDHKEALVLGLRPLFYRVQHSYYSLRRFERIETGLGEVESLLSHGKTGEANFHYRNLLQREKYFLEILNVKKELTPSTISALKQEIQFVENRKIDQFMKILENIDVYTEAKTLLENPPNAATKEKTDFALEALEGSKARENFQEMVGKTKAFQAPKLSELKDLLENNPMMEIMHLEKELRKRKMDKYRL